MWTARLEQLEVSGTPGVLLARIAYHDSADLEKTQLYVKDFQINDSTTKNDFQKLVIEVGLKAKATHDKLVTIKTVLPIGAEIDIT